MRMLLVAFAVLFLMCGTSFAQGLEIGQKVTGVVLPQVDGRKVDLTKVIGNKPVVIWICDMGPVAGGGVDNLKSIYASYSRDKIEVYVIGTAGAQKATEFIKENEFHIPVLLGGEDPLTTKLTGESPVTSPIVNLFIIDRKGILQYSGFLPGLPTRKIEVEITKVI